MTHTFVTMEVSRAAYDEIAGKMRDAGYGHAFVDGLIDMHGIALECGRVEYSSELDAELAKEMAHPPKSIMKEH